MRDLQSQTELLEFEIHTTPDIIVEQLLARSPRIIGFGVYIWNVEQTFAVIQMLKALAPEIIIVLGGPEVSYETENQPIVLISDYVITGEADQAFHTLCAALEAGARPHEKIIRAALPPLEELTLPYPLYSDADLANRVIYCELSRGCPFTCEFCLSSIDIPVRQFDVDQVLTALETLMQRGARQFKFVDRTFNLNIQIGKKVLEFFLARYTDGLFLHFEMVPDRLPPALRTIIEKFPAGALQFEIGIQSFNPEVGKLISRRQDFVKMRDNLIYLRSQTQVHLHVDLIVGLPGESIESFGKGFDELVALHPHEIQVGILKRLKGTPIARHDSEWGMVYNAKPPYEILKTKLVTFQELQQMRRFARYWDLVANSGRFLTTLPLLLEKTTSPFATFQHFSEWLYQQIGKRHAIAAEVLAEKLFHYLTEELEISIDETLSLLEQDDRRQKGALRTERLSLRAGTSTKQVGVPPGHVKRQTRHSAIAL